MDVFKTSPDSTMGTKQNRHHGVRSSDEAIESWSSTPSPGSCLVSRTRHLTTSFLRRLQSRRRTSANSSPILSPDGFQQRSVRWLHPTRLCTRSNGSQGRLVLVARSGAGPAAKTGRKTSFAIAIPLTRVQTQTFATKCHRV